ncbi:hypothetical protein [Klebsiella michiganensis]|uniref:hypothetical protein n=1 Tax=Klebsiella michiganensis TaxID=1134687 RepID=UPI001CCAD7B6|nr:hypothetical protein [Klebsiella michiganensis]
MSFFEIDSRFVMDTAFHRLEIIRDDGLYRHLRMQQPGTSNYYYDVITWRVRKAQNKKRMKTGATMTIRQIAIKPGCEKLSVNYAVLSLTMTLKLTTPFMTLIGLKGLAHGIYATA